MSAPRLTPEYEARLRALLGEFRRSAAALKDSLEALDMLDYMELLAPPSQSPESLGLTAAEMTLLAPELDEDELDDEDEDDEDDEDDDPELGRN